jgi:PhoH-like ATPase
MLPEGLPNGKANNQIPGIVRNVETEQPGSTIVYVSQDINMRIKARTLGLPAEDHFKGHVLEDTDLLYSGRLHSATERFLNQSLQRP